jgi:hypothetical protein
MKELDAVFSALAQSAFRRKFHLKAQEREYLQNKGLSMVLQHARTFIEQRLTASMPVNDGKQTPFRGHPVFIAQHATATCCRGCLEKWHRIPRDQALNEEQIQYIVAVLARWLESESDDVKHIPAIRDLFDDQ